MSSKNRHSISAEKKQAKAERYRQNVAKRKSISNLSAVFQFFWVMLLLPRAIYYIVGPKPSVVEIVVISLIVLAVYNQIRIYRPLFFRLIGRRISDKLITNGWFRFTRHPMYTLVLIADIINFYYVPLDWKLALHTSVFYAVTVVTCYIHEQEVVSKFGDEAKQHYANTPRLIFMYPFRRWVLV